MRWSRNIITPVFGWKMRGSTLRTSSGRFFIAKQKVSNTDGLENSKHILKITCCNAYMTTSWPLTTYQLVYYILMYCILSTSTELLYTKNTCIWTIYVTSKSAEYTWRHVCFAIWKTNVLSELSRAGASAPRLLITSCHDGCFTYGMCPT